MHKLESVQENEIHTILWDFEIQMDPLIPARSLDQGLINKCKGTCYVVDFSFPIDHRVKKKKAKR